MYFSRRQVENYSLLEGFRMDSEFGTANKKCQILRVGLLCHFMFSHKGKTMRFQETVILSEIFCEFLNGNWVSDITLTCKKIYHCWTLTFSLAVGVV